MRVQAETEVLEQRSLRPCRWLTYFALLLPVIAYHFAADAAIAAVPPSLVQRAQEASVETIIAALEAKSSAINGTWKFTSGAQDEPATAYISGLNGRKWYVRQAEAAPGELLFCDGDEFFEPAARLRYWLDTAEQGRRMDYGLGSHLLHVNLRPRQFLGPRSIKNMGEAKINGVRCVRLLARIYSDEALKQDPYAETAPRQRRVGSIFYYYDPARNAISRASVVFTADYKSVCSVASWDKFGTTVDWPKTMTGDVWDTSQPKERRTGKPSLCSVQNFTPGIDEQVATSEQVASAVPFYAGIPDDLRQPKTYLAALESGAESLTERIFLAQSHFASEQPRQGLEQWKLLEQELTQESQRRFLVEVLTEPAANSMSWRSVREKEQAPACVELIRRLVDLNLTDELWEPSSRRVCLAWSLFRDRSQFSEELAPLDEVIIDRVGRRGDETALLVAIQFAERNEDFAAKINPVLASVAAGPLPPEGYVGTQQSRLVAVSVYHDYWDRADAYIAKLRWDPATPNGAKAAVELMKAVLAQRARLLDDQFGAVIVDQYNHAADPALAADWFTRRACRAAAVKLAAESVRRWASQTADAPPPAALVAASAVKPNAAEFWDAVIAHLLSKRASSEEATSVLIASASELGAACGAQFNLPDYESGTYLRIHGAKLLDPKVHSPLDNMDFLNQAFAKASLDRTRIEAVKAIIGLLGGLGQHDQAVQVVGSLRNSLVDDRSQVVMDGLLSGIEKDKALFAANAAKREKQIYLDRLEGQIAYLNERLAEAQRLSKPQASLDSLRQTLDRAKQELTQSRDAAH